MAENKSRGKKRGFDAYPPDSHCPSLDHIRFLIVLNFHPTGFHDGSRPMTLGADVILAAVTTCYCTNND
jgi:hypothetical protein